MATLYWEPKALTVAQVVTVQITADDAATTYTITIGGVTVSVAGSGTGVNDTATALAAALDASTHPYFGAASTLISWAAATDTVTGTSDVAGVPFVASSSVTGGTGTIGAVTTTTAATGPNFWDNADNWSTGAVPVSSDTVYVRGSAIPIAWGLDQSAVDLAALFWDLTYIGKLGLRRDSFAINADATDFDTTVPEYRQGYLKIGYDACDIGLQRGPGTANGSTRLKIDNDRAAASETRIHSTASTGENNKAAVLLLAANANADVEVRSAPGGVGLATDEPGETSTFGDITITDTTTTSSVYCGEGVTLSNWTQRGGQNELAAAADITSVTVDGGTLKLDGGDYTVTTCNHNGGTTTDNHRDATALITTLNLNGGTIDFSKRRIETRTVATVVYEGGTLKADFDTLAITTNTEPTGRKQITVSNL